MGVGAFPTGVVTFLLTDVVDSTALWERAPDVMDAALVRHDEIIANAVSAEGGTLLRSKGEGDSTFSVFSRATDALRAAYRLQQAMRREQWPADAVIRTRVGVDTGEAVERAGDYYGTAVNRVARLRTAAQGANIIVGATAAALTRRTLPEGCELVELGLLQLRGLEKPEQAFALAASDLEPVDPSRLRFVSTLPAALAMAAEAGPLVGRHDELEKLRALWPQARSGRSRMVLVTGEAGIGKTRLVAELAAELHCSGAAVIFGACFEDEPSAYQPFVQALGVHLRNVQQTTDPRMTDETRALARLLSSEPGADLSEVVDASTEREEVFGVLYRSFASLAETTPLLLVLEDLHWATPTTRAVLLHIARVARVPLLVVATSRDAPPDATDELSRFLGELARHPSVQRIRLEVLDRPAVAELVAATEYAGDAINGDLVWAHSGGNPLFVREMLANPRRGAWTGTSVGLARTSS